MMVTHNMANAIEYGNRLIMMNNGKIIYDVKGEEKKKLTVDDLLQKFEEASGSALNNDRMLLSGNKLHLLYTNPRRAPAGIFLEVPINKKFPEI